MRDYLTLGRVYTLEVQAVGELERSEGSDFVFVCEWRDRVAVPVVGD